MADGVRLRDWPYKTRINMDLIWRDKHENRRAAVVPKLTMKLGDLRSLYSLHLFEVDERGFVRTENPIQFQLLKGSA